MHRTVPAGKLLAGLTPIGAGPAGDRPYVIPPQGDDFMKFTKSSQPLATTDFVAAEQQTGLRLPHAVRAAYLSANGGVPDPYVFENDEVDTVVSEFLPLASASRSYARLVGEKRLVPPHFLPFAVDGGGDYFFVDCATPDGAVHYFRGDAAAPRLVDLHLSFDQFWASLKNE